VHANRPVVLDAIRIFGVERCMFASNFPVDRLVGEYATIFGGFLAITGHLPEADRRLLFHDNALRYYRLQP
jgi:predicted TIM-barrel fold metal-dependent hydrolase